MMKTPKKAPKAPGGKIAGDRSNFAQDPKEKGRTLPDDEDDDDFDLPLDEGIDDLDVYDDEEDDF